MDQDADEMQHLQAGGILRESIKLVSGRERRLLASLAALLVLPLSLVILGHSLLTEPLAEKIGQNSDRLATEASQGQSSKDTINVLYMEIGRLAVMIVVYYVFVLALSLVSTAAVVYSVACIYLDRQVSLRLVLEVVPRVWKRLMVTFNWAFLLMFAFQVLFGVTLVAILMLFKNPVALLFIFALIFVGLHAYINLVWHLASVVTVLEDYSGLGALRKSVNLMKGRRRVGIILVCIYMFVTGLITAFFRTSVVSADKRGFQTWFFGLVLILALTLANLVGLLAQSLYYFTLKSYHHESIDRMLLADQLDSYLGDYVPLKDPPSTIALGTIHTLGDEEDDDSEV